VTGPGAMGEFYTFAGEHYFLAWSALWLIWGAVYLAVLAIAMPIKLCSRILRAVMVSARGWPPEHLDADGDFRPEDEA
jgi:hypothetical protein